MSEHDSNALLAEILRRIDAGEQVDIESICESHPEIADDLRSYVDGDALLADMAADDAEGDTSQPGVYDETVRPRGQAGPAIDMSGQSFGRYQIKRQLGQGAMGAVYLARDTQLDRDVALKIPKVGLAGHDEFLKRFKREAQSAANLNHPGICPVFDFGEQDGLPFITMAYIEGEPLSRFVGRKQVDNQWVADTVQKIADALAHAHEQGVVHRDLKSANVLVNRGGEPIVTDFGLAVRVDQNDETRITQVGALVGTPAYMSPEQIEGESSLIGPPSDVYALGVILYELLAGELPFRGSMGSLIAQITRDEPKSPIKRNPDADPGLCDLCLKMMSKRASQRPESMAAVAKLLSDLVIGAGKPKPFDDKTNKKLAKLEAGKARVADLVQRGQFAQAVSILEKMAAVKDKDSTDYATWASAEIKRIKAMPKKLRDGAPQLLAAATKMMARHDYGQAAQMLQQVPADMRSPEAAALLHEAIELQDEADLLLTDLHDCVATRTYDGIEDNVQRLLELKPGNKFARELWEALETYQKVPRAQRTYRFASDGTLQPREEGLGKGLLAGIGVAVIAFGAMAFAMKGYLADESPDAGKVTVDRVDEPEREAESTGAGTSSPAVPVSAGGDWTDLFNGRDFTGWRTSNGEVPESQWTVRNGLLVATQPQCALLTTQNFDEFELEVEWKLDKPGNSGIVYRIQGEGDSLFGRGIEYQIVDTKGNQRLDPTKQTGALYGIAGSQTTNAPRGEFNTSRIVVREERIQHWLNGQMVADVVPDGPLWKQRVASMPTQGPYKDGFDCGVYATTKPGPIGLSQFNGESPEFRSIRVRPLQSSRSLSSKLGWTSFFNGRDFTGWREYGGGAVGDGWDVNNGELQITGRGNGIVTNATYDNFELEFEWATSDAGGDTGLFYRVSENRNSINFDGLEYQIFDNPESSVWNDPARRSGALFGISGQALPIKPRGEFNTSRVIADGDRLEHWLNGVKVCEATIGGAAWDAALSDRDRQKFRDYPLASSGHIGIQSFGNPVRFRNMRIRELTPRPAPAIASPSWTSLFNGRDFTGWQYYSGGPIKKGWEVRDGQLCITPSPRKAVSGYPYDIITTDTYDNFELEFEWKALQAANSGVMYRVTQDAELPFETGIEYQVLDDPASNDTQLDIRKTGSIYGLFGRTVSLRPSGQFNQSRIIANGDHVEHWLNGQLVAETDIGSSGWNKAVRAGKPSEWPQFMKSPRGHICLQNKGQAVCYRNLRIREIETSPAELAWVDLLSTSSRPAIETGWERLPSGELGFDGSRLVFDEARGTQYMSLPFEQKVSFPYELEIAGTATSDLSQLATTLPVANGFAAFVLMTERPRYRGNFGGLEMIDGVSFKENPRHVTKPILVTGQFDLRFVVDSDSDVTSVTVWNAGQQIYTWSGPTSSLSLDNQWLHGKPNHIGIGAIGPDKGRANDGTLTKVRVRPAATNAQ